MNPVISNHLLMIRPAQFGFNEQTSATNAFQKKLSPHSFQTDINPPFLNPEEVLRNPLTNHDQIAQRAMLEFDQSVARIQSAGVQVTVWYDSPHPPKPDAVFLNNWFSTHLGGQYILYPMMAENRRAEIDPTHVAALESMGFNMGLDLRSQVEANQFLEGTGSLVFDHQHHVVFATDSPRTHRNTAELVAKHLDYDLIFMLTNDKFGDPPYHTNVVLSVGPTLAIACLDVIEQTGVSTIRNQLMRHNRTLIEINEDQMGSFCANVLEVQNTDGGQHLVVSRTAWNAFTEQQRQLISGLLKPIILDIPLIERMGGGSARCMLAEVFGT